MAERYTRLLSLEKPKWNSNSPVILEKGALLRDNVKNKNLLQFQFKNIGKDIIKAISIGVNCFDEITQTNLEQLEFTYLDLDVKSTDIFGSNVPIFLQNEETRVFSIYIKKIIFIDGSVRELDVELKDIELPKSITELGELQNQFAVELKTLNSSVKCTTYPQKHEEYWYCACGAFNTIDDQDCQVCGCNYTKLIASLDLENLRIAYQQELNIRNEEEKQSSIKKQKRLKTILSIGGLIVIGLLVSFIFNSIVPSNRLTFNSVEDMFTYMEGTWYGQDLTNYSYMTFGSKGSVLKLTEKGHGFISDKVLYYPSKGYIKKLNTKYILTTDSLLIDSKSKVAYSKSPSKEENIVDYELEISNIQIGKKSGYSNCSGTLVNNSNKTYNNILITGVFKDSSGTVVTEYQRIVIDAKGLAPGETYKFILAVDYSPEITSCSLTISHFDKIVAE